MTALDDHPFAVPPARFPVARQASSPPAQAPGATPREASGCDLAEAQEFLELFHTEHPRAGLLRSRLAQVRAEVAVHGTYRHTPLELAFGARVAWRNAARCIGRLYWRRLRVRDLRHVTDAAMVAVECAEHLRLATSGGRIRPLISIFAPDAPGKPGPRIYNEQLIRYAGYRESHGGVRGDPRYADFTSALIQRGWQPPEPSGHFDVLPLMVETTQDGPRIAEVPREAILEVPLRHPELGWFEELGLRWHAVPAISHMRLRIGGVDYPAAPFNGWYLGTEIGARNLADT
ncbi:MAG: nitric oxide synthase oxygenase, partial [Pseudonocardiaceae bacterium]